ncbi:MAG: hypothetical protein MI757_07700 [Pirellulales bacterium]|nr:hypothetical protein [Pirellulales bacterium]
MRKEELDPLVENASEAPFTIHMSDGSHYEVTHPAMIAVGKFTAIVLVANGKDVDTYERLALIHMVRIKQESKRPA